MAAAKSGLLGSTNAASTTNPNGVKTNAASTSAQPYQGGLNTDFSGLQDSTPLYSGNGSDDSQRAGNSKYMSNVSGINGNDPDEVQANYQAWQLQNNPEGMDTAASQALENMYTGRIGEKNSLAQQIAGSDSQLTQQQDLNKAAAGSAVGQGLKNTRQNFNDRGLLYSGAREGGEAAVKAAGASQLATSMAGTARDAANSKTAAENAYASVDLATQQANLNLSNQAFDTASANNIARLQATQQLAGGVGTAIGTIAGSQSPSGPSYQNPAGGLGSSYAPNGNYGLLGGSQSQSAVGQ
jgi:hypothetical protein